MSTFLDFDPVTGVAHYLDYDEMSGNATIQTVQDVEPLLNYTKACANDGLKDKGIKENWWLYAKIPPVVQVAMHKKGIKLNDPSATKRIIQEINEHYAHLKCTQKNHLGKVSQLFVPGKHAE